MLVTISNDFHNTSTRTKQGRKTHLQALAVKRRLCGVKGCTCSGSVGERGKQIQPDGTRLLIDYDSNNDVILSIR